MLKNGYTPRYRYEDPKNIPDAKYPNSKFNQAIKQNQNNFKSNIGFLGKLGGGLAAGGYGLKKLNDLNDHPSNLHDFGHVGKMFGIGENDSSAGAIGTSTPSSSEAMSSTGGNFPIQQDKINFKERLKNLKLRRRP